LSQLLSTAGTTAVATLVAQAVGATIAAFSAVQGELRITLYIIALQVLLMAGSYLSVRRQSAKTPVPEGERSLIPTSIILVAAGLVVALLTFAFVYIWLRVEHVIGKAPASFAIPGYAGPTSGDVVCVR